MSTTVSYKGSTIGTAENSTLTLSTEGTWMEDDVTIVDVTSGSATIESLSVTANGTYTAPSGVDGYSPVTVNVSGGSSTLGTKTISANGTYTASDDGYDGYSSVTVSVSGGGGYDINDIADGSEPSGALTLSTATSIYAYAFFGRSALTSVTASACITLNDNAFNNCTGLTSISFPEVTTFSAGSLFANCTGLTAVAFPSLTSTTQSRTFYNCTGLTIADMGTTTQVTSQCFMNASALRTLILRKTNAVATLGAYNVYTLGGIYNNPTESTIYVPSALLSSYQSASNWSSLYSAGCTFTAIEGSIYETQYGDGTAIA